MHTKLTLNEIKQAAKDLKKKKPKLKHTQALNQIAQECGYEKFEILKAKAKSDNGELYILVETKRKIIKIIQSLSDFFYEDEGSRYLPNLYKQQNTNGEGAIVKMVSLEDYPKTFPIERAWGKSYATFFAQKQKEERARNTASISKEDARRVLANASSFLLKNNTVLAVSKTTGIAKELKSPSGSGMSFALQKQISEHEIKGYKIIYGGREEPSKLILPFFDTPNAEED